MYEKSFDISIMGLNRWISCLQRCWVGEATPQVLFSEIHVTNASGKIVCVCVFFFVRHNLRSFIQTHSDIDQHNHGEFKQ